MRVGVMLRAFDEKGGVGVYTRNITKELLELDNKNEYFLYYKNKANIGSFAEYPNAHEKAIVISNKVLWDQVAIPRACLRDDIDVLFHPKFTVPLFGNFKTVMVLHGAGWFIPETKQFWSRSSRFYVRLMMPVYCRRASSVLAVSNITKDVFDRTFKLPPDKIQTVYFGPGRQFRPIAESQNTQDIKRKYDLPDHFILTLSGGDRGERKNIGAILEAYRRIHGRIFHKLVVVGRDCDRFRSRYGIPGNGYGQDILFPGWVDQQDLPAFYNLAAVFLYPSQMEAFPIPITEALACGRPIITSNAYGLKELAGDAALLVDPGSVEDIVKALQDVLTNNELSATLSRNALNRSRLFSWDQCAGETLSILNRIGGQAV